jgi:hypothetical protein
MSTALRISTRQRTGPRRTRILAAASGLVAAASIAVTLAVAEGGSSDATSSPSAIPTHAHPDRATLYQRSVQAPQAGMSIDGQRAAERFHHFR